MKYKCVNSFTVDNCDGDGFLKDGYVEINRGSIWELDEKTNIIGGEVHLENPGTMEWLEIPVEDLEVYFEPLT